MDLMKLRDELIRDEGRRLAAYQDTNGLWTIGVGHLLGAHARMTIITDAECDALLASDIRLATQAADRIVPGWANWDLNHEDMNGEARQRALINMIFNRGEGQMMKSTRITPAILAASRGTSTWALVAQAIVTSQWAGQVGDRAIRLAAMFESGQTA
jgi:lysozyme